MKSSRFRTEFIHLLGKIDSFDVCIDGQMGRK
jgi:hypothetical protein